MIINTLYNEGDWVYAYYNDIPKSGVITAISIMVGADPSPTIMYTINGVPYAEDFVKASKLDLIANAETILDANNAAQKTAIADLINALPES